MNAGDHDPGSRPEAGKARDAFLANDHDPRPSTTTQTTCSAPSCVPWPGSQLAGSLLGAPLLFLLFAELVQHHRTGRHISTNSTVLGRSLQVVETDVQASLSGWAGVVLSSQ